VEIHTNNEGSKQREALRTVYFMAFAEVCVSFPVYGQLL
jgi:hypothetical protein